MLGSLCPFYLFIILVCVFSDFPAWLGNSVTRHLSYKCGEGQQEHVNAGFLLPFVMFSHVSFPFFPLLSTVFLESKNLLQAMVTCCVFICVQNKGSCEMSALP